MGGEPGVTAEEPGVEAPLRTDRERADSVPLREVTKCVDYSDADM